MNFFILSIYMWVSYICYDAGSKATYMTAILKLKISSYVVSNETIRKKFI